MLGRWALGILVYELLVGRPPFRDTNILALYDREAAGYHGTGMIPVPAGS